MPLFYDNAGPSGGIKSLSLHFRGAPENSGQLYVKINNTKVLYAAMPRISRDRLAGWNIDLSARSPAT
jgi:hypothetical protein